MACLDRFADPYNPVNVLSCVYISKVTLLIWWQYRNEASQAREQSNLKTIKDSAHVHRCIQWFWVIESVLSSSGNLLRRRCNNWRGTQEIFWLVIARKAQADLIPLVMALSRQYEDYQGRGVGTNEMQWIHLCLLCPVMLKCAVRCGGSQITLPPWDYVQRLIFPFPTAQTSDKVRCIFHVLHHADLETCSANVLCKCCVITLHCNLKADLIATTMKAIYCMNTWEYSDK